MLKKILFLIGGLAILVFAMLMAGSGVSYFMNLPSFVFVIGGTFFIASSSYGKVKFDRKFFKLCSKNILQVGITGTLIGVVLILGNLKPGINAANGASVALITLFYSLIIKYFILDPLLYEDK